MPVVRHPLIWRRNLNPGKALLEEAVHRPLRVKYGLVDPHVVRYPVADLAACRFAFTLTELMKLAEDRREAVGEIEACIAASPDPSLRVFLSHLCHFNAV